MTTNPGATPTRCASGRFDVQLSPLPPREDAASPLLGRLRLDKEFTGDLQADGRGEMLTAGTDELGSAGYVAIEHISGTLHGRRGSFVFQHSGQMNRGAPSLAISVVPDSGTGELIGLAGTFSIEIVDGQHFYRFDYTLP